MPKHCQNIAKYAPKYGQTSLNFRSRFQVKISYLGERLVYRTIAAATAHKCNAFKSNSNRINSVRNGRINSVRNVWDLKNEFENSNLAVLISAAAVENIRHICQNIAKYPSYFPEFQSEFRTGR